MRWFGWFSRRRRYEELSASIQEHLDEKVEDLMETGLSHEEAIHAARRAFGNVTRVEERSREIWQSSWVESIWADLKFALRKLRSSPGFTITAVLTLALGIGANTAIFSTMNAVLLRMLPVRDPQQLYNLTHEQQPNGVGDTGDPNKTFGINVYNRLRADKRVFSDVVAFVPLAAGKISARFANIPEELEADEVSGNFFSALGVHMAAGLPFGQEDEDQHSAVAVLSYGYWTRRFNRDPGVIGKTIYLNGAAMTIVGVAGPHFYGVESGGVATDLWVPLQTRAELPAWGIPISMQTMWKTPNWWALMLIARLRPGISEEKALAYENPLFQYATWETVGKDVHRNKQPLTLTLTPARGLGTASSGYEQPLYVQMGMVALVLLIACINVAMLLTARNAVREREFSMRLALGAGRWPLFRQLMAESVLLVGAGTGLGWLIALEATKLLAAWSQVQISFAPDRQVLLFTLTVSIAATFLFGLAPLRVAANAPVTLALKSGSTQTTQSRTAVVAGKVLIVAQMALCAALLFAAGLLVRTLQNYQNIDLGFHADKVLAFGAHPIGKRNSPQMVAFYNELMQRIHLLPGVQSVTLAGNRPGSGWSDNNNVILDGHAYPAENDTDLLQSNNVGPNYFETLGIPVVIGRGITAADTEESGYRAAVVNQTLANRYLHGQSPIGHKLGDPKYPFTIVGVVKDSKYTDVSEAPRPMAWYSWQQTTPSVNMDVEVRAAGNPLNLLPEIRRIMFQLDPDVPLQDPKVLSVEFEQGYATSALYARLAAFFGGLAALLVAVGLYGTLAYRVNRRTLEIGVRMALGAPRRRMLWMILCDSLILVGAGLSVGLPLAWFGSKFLESMLYKLHPHDPASFALAVFGVLFVSLAASWLPARRAASVSPMKALRAE